MCWKIRLIVNYLFVNQAFKERLQYYCQRMSNNNSLQLTDGEVVTIYCGASCPGFHFHAYFLGRLIICAEFGAVALLGFVFRKRAGDTFHLCPASVTIVTVFLLYFVIIPVSGR
jgi:hypothetical protein